MWSLLLCQGHSLSFLSSGLSHSTPFKQMLSLMHLFGLVHLPVSVTSRIRFVTTNPVLIRQWQASIYLLDTSRLDSRSVEIQCLSVHLGSQRKRLCPYCRQKIDSSAVNLSLQRLIDSFVNLQEKRQLPLDTEHEKEHFLDKLSAAETRSDILRKELDAAVDRKSLLEFEMSNINGLYRRLRHKQAEARERLRTVTAENESIDKEIRLVESQRADVRKRVDEEHARTALVDSSLKGLTTECEKYRLCLLNQGL